jgi:hypothetical protein
MQQQGEERCSPPNFWVIIETREDPLDEARILGLQAAGQMLIIPDLVLMQEPQHLCINPSKSPEN